MSGKNGRLSQWDTGAAFQRRRGKMLATAAKGVMASTPGERQGEIFVAGIKSEE